MAVPASPPLPAEAPSIPAGLIAELRRFEPRLDVHWNQRVGRWQVVEWVESFQRWCSDFFWQGEDGSFRPLPATAEPLIAKLREIDWQNYQNLNRAVARDKIARELDGPRLAALAARKAKIDESTREYVRDFAHRALGVRQTFGAGSLRSRRFVQNGSEVHRKFWRGLLSERPTRGDG